MFEDTETLNPSGFTISHKLLQVLDSLNIVSIDVESRQCNPLDGLEISLKVSSEAFYQNLRGSVDAKHSQLDTDT